MPGLRAIEVEYFNKGVQTERARVLRLIDDSIAGWWRLYNEAGPNADASVDTVIAELEQLREDVDALKEKE